MNATKRLLLLRHGETAWTLAGRYTGFTDLPLTAVGRTEARSQQPTLQHLLADQTPLVYVSPRQRTVEMQQDPDDRRAGEGDGRRGDLRRDGERAARSISFGGH